MRTRTVRQVKRAFTLIEILIVVVILGILAAIVIPQFTDASEEAAASAAQSTLQTIRGQLELCRVKGDCPCSLPADLADLWSDMVGDGYLQSAPVLPGSYAWDVDTSGACDRLAIDGETW